MVRAEGSDSDYYDQFGNVRTPDLRPYLDFRLDLGSLQYLYLINIRILPSAPENFDVVHVSTLPKYDTPNALPAHHILIRGCEIAGYSGSASTPSRYEVLKVNHAENLYVESCQIHRASGDGKNAVDMVAVRFGHIVDCDLYDSPDDWVAYVKGGSAYLRIEGNRIFDGRNGFTLGEGSDCDKMTSPFHHYETYGCQFVNNLIWGIGQTALGVYGGYNALIAYNTLYDVARTTGAMMEFVLGHRRCGEGSDQTTTDVSECRHKIDNRLFVMKRGARCC